MLMHGEPSTMQLSPMQGRITAEVKRFLVEQTDALMQRGVARSRIALDPGVGFGKTVAQNFELLAEQNQFLDVAQPLLLGWSRKSSLGAVTGCAVDERVVPSVAAALLCVERGAHVVRVHDVAETVAALKVWRAALRQSF